MVTTDTLTDRQVQDLWYAGKISSRTCDDAQVELDGPQVRACHPVARHIIAMERRAAREHCANLINARSEHS